MTSRKWATWYVYIVEGRSGALYTGITLDLDRRVKEHNTSKRGSKWARGERPVRLVWNYACPGHTVALRVERSIKSWSAESKARLVAGQNKIHSW